MSIPRDWAKVKSSPDFGDGRYLHTPIPENVHEAIKQPLSMTREFPCKSYITFLYVLNFFVVRASC